MVKGELGIGQVRVRKAETSMLVCAAYGESYEESQLGALTRMILREKPACCYACNKALGQAK